MVNNLVFRWPKTFMFHGFGGSYVLSNQKLLSLVFVPLDPPNPWGNHEGFSPKNMWGPITMPTSIPNQLKPPNKFTGFVLFHVSSL